MTTSSPSVSRWMRTTTSPFESMTTDEQIEALYRFRYPDHDFDWLLPAHDGLPQVRTLHHAPKGAGEWTKAADLANDLNAMREFECHIAPVEEGWRMHHADRWNLYKILLKRCFRRTAPDCYGHDEILMLAPASCRLESMVRAVGRWRADFKS